MNVTQTNLERFKEAQTANPTGTIYLALDMGHEVRAVMTDKEQFARWLWKTNRVSGVAIIEAVLDAPETACYYSLEDYLAPFARKFIEEGTDGNT